PLLALTLCVAATAGDTEHFPKGSRKDLSQLGFVDTHGKKCTVADFKGKVVLVDFWVVWCGPCRSAIPEIKALQKQGAEKGTLVVIPCNLDDEYWPQGVLTFFRKNEKALEGFTYYRAQMGRNGIGTNLGGDISSYPTTLVIDRDGRLAARWSGYGEGAAVYEINQVMKEQP
ncbi:MAG TPA: TlpA disulfide reductase family protein, partial [Holophagaceae bacterium]|nr:TlpA disulfide reductase family protein [Holophagaceae bacterium]